jgi:hypothetical protein
VQHAPNTNWLLEEESSAGFTTHIGVKERKGWSLKLKEDPMYRN